MAVTVQLKTRRPHRACRYPAHIHHVGDRCSAPACFSPRTNRYLGMLWSRQRYWAAAGTRAIVMKRCGRATFDEFNLCSGRSGVIRERKFAYFEYIGFHGTLRQGVLLCCMLRVIRIRYRRVSSTIRSRGFETQSTLRSGRSQLITGRKVRRLLLLFVPLPSFPLPLLPPPRAPIRPSSPSLPRLHTCGQLCFCFWSLAIVVRNPSEVLYRRPQWRYVEKER